MLPFSKLFLKNLRCFAEAEIPLDPRVTVLIGENGCGKTTAAEALASLTYGTEEGLEQYPLRHGSRSGEIALYRGRSRRTAASWRHRRGGDRHERLPQEDYLFVYGRYRRVFFAEEEYEGSGPYPSPPLLLSELAEHADRRRSATLNRPDNHLLRDISRYVFALDEARASEPQAQRAWDELNGSLEHIGQGISEIRIDEREGGRVPVVVRYGVPLRLEELSDGYQAILVVLFDLILRYIYLFSFRENPLEGEAFVVVDEVDLHLHPRWQRTAVEHFANLFPKTQFLFTTHSPAVVQAALDKGRKVVLLESSEDEVQVRPIGRDLARKLKGADIGSLLLDPRLFQVGSHYSTHYEKREEFVREMRTKMEQGESSEAEVEKLLAAIQELHAIISKNEKRRADGAYMADLVGLQTAFIADLAAELRSLRG